MCERVRIYKSGYLCACAYAYARMCERIMCVYFTLLFDLQLCLHMIGVSRSPVSDVQWSLVFLPVVSIRVLGEVEGL